MPIFVTLIKRYENLMKMLESKSPAVAKHKKELFGSSPPMASSELYNTMTVAKELGIPYPDFINYSLRDQALMTAHFYLRNIAETMQRHDDIMVRNEEAVAQKAKDRMRKK